MDGVPGVSFAGIKPGATFEYRFRVKQSGTYWYHSHSGGQEQAGVYGPIIIDPSGPDPIQADRDYVVLLSDWTTKSADAMIGDLKKQSGVYNYQRRTLPEFLRDAKRDGLGAATRNYALWSKMRMDPTDLLDVTSARYTYLMNGSAPESNWTGLFKPGERVRLRFIQAGAMTFQDVRIPGLKMTVVQADGQNIQPVEVDEFRIGPAETYDVIVQPDDDKAYTIFAETLDRNGYARGTLAPRSGMTAAIPARRPRPLRTMEDMGMSMQGGDMAGMPGMKGMSGMSGMKDAHGTKDMPGMKKPAGKDSGHDMANMPMPPNAADKGTPAQPPPDPAKAHDMANMSSPKANDPHAGHNMAGMAGKAPATSIPGSEPVKHNGDRHGSGNQTIPEETRARLNDPGIGLGNDGWKVLVYTDLKSLAPYPDQRQPERELEIHLTGHMERFMWSFDGKKYSQAKDPIRFQLGERLRWTFVNDTMMEHTLHLHGMWMYLENGTGNLLPRKHTVLVKPAERLSVAITADAAGPWAFHCHLLLHMEVGMFRVVLVAPKNVRTQA